MKRTKLKISIIALALVFMFSVAALFAVNFAPAHAASNVSVGGSNLFTPGGSGASVIVDRQVEKEAEEEGEETTYVYYTMFEFAYNDDSITFKKHLAYNWWEELSEEVPAEDDDKTDEGEEGEKDEEKEPEVVKTLVNGMFNMEIGFKNTDFKRFVITFESQQYTKTEEGKSVNYIIFFPDGADFVKVLITDNKDATEDDLQNNTPIARDHIHIRFVEKLVGEYRVIVSEDPEATQDGQGAVEGFLKNVSGNYAKYSSSSTSVFPLAFNAEFDEEENENREDAKPARMVLYCLNNQRFKINDNSVTEEGDHWKGGSLYDDTPAVLCLNKDISYLERGGSISFDYQAIDVVRTTSSPDVKFYYYMLTCDDLENGTIDFNDYNDIYDKKDNKNGKFKLVESDRLLESSVDIYLPELGVDGGTAYGKEFKIDAAVKVFAKIQDSTNSGETSYVFLDWYIEDDLKLNIGGTNFIAVGENSEGVRYNYDDETGTGWSKEADGLLAKYQEKVTEAAKNLSAGSSSYFYVPSAEELFVDDTTAYTDMKISIYYFNATQSQNTSLASNNLSINISKAGPYLFTLYATDAKGNSMFYFDKDEKDGDEYKKVEFSAGEIWKMYDDEDLRGYLPWFEFNVDYKGVEFKEVPGAQNTAHVGTVYSSASFDINGIDGTYSVKYRLFLFDSASYYKQFKEVPSYERFIEIMDDLFEDEATVKYFNEIKEVNESDEDYEKFKDYNWKSSSTSFIPQDGNAFYYMRAEAKDTGYNTEPITCSLAIVASREARSLKGDSDWLKNNVASVILLSIAGVSLVAIVLLLVIKPKNKEDIDVQFEKEKSKKKGK